MDKYVREVDLLTKTSEILEGFGRGDSNISTTCRKLMEQVGEISQEIRSLRNMLDGQKKQIETCKDLMKDINYIEKLNAYIENSASDMQLCNGDSTEESTTYHPSSASQPWNLVSPQYSVPSSKKSLHHTPSRPRITPLLREEFDDIPKYMKGRLTYETVCNFIAAFNSTLQKKYQLFSRPRNTLKGRMLTQYDIYKKQENKETIEKGIYFCTAEDLKSMGKLKFDKAEQNIMNILRHAKRMREIRSTGIVRYAVLN
ncbi:SKA complex subunit 1-like isoform X2 [Periplaneta americana]|uniref:SKA complex subunit 1-like isoform X2 n=1 Tax=Periplaneta americana TaxID=6978 RepID=UPI0037E9C285